MALASLVPQNCSYCAGVPLALNIYFFYYCFSLYLWHSFWKYFQVDLKQKQWIKHTVCKSYSVFVQCNKNNFITPSIRIFWHKFVIVQNIYQNSFVYACVVNIYYSQSELLLNKRYVIDWRSSWKYENILDVHTEYILSTIGVDEGISGALDWNTIPFQFVLWL